MTEHELVKFSNFTIQANKEVTFRANKCIFAKIHDSEAYALSKVRFCPWGMIGSSIVTNHVGKDTTIKQCQFVTRGTITKIENLKE